MDEIKGFKGVKEFDVVLQIPLRVRMKLLDETQRNSFVDDCMAHPRNCDNDWTEPQNRAWFSEIWRQQIKFQRALLTNPEHLRSFLCYCALDQVATPSLLNEGGPFLPIPDLENIASPIAEHIGARKHFLPPAHLGVTTGCMLSVLLDDALDLKPSGEPSVILPNG